MELEKKEFNLLHEPFLLVRGQDDAVTEVSLLTLFENAHVYRGLCGELPTQDVAVLRLLLAILHGVFARVDEAGRPGELELPHQAIDRWGALWGMGRFPYEVIADYLGRYEERFYLFHPERPFYQVPQAEIGTAYEASKLNGAMSESNHKLRLFPSRTGEGRNAIPYSQAARWLLYLNAFDDTSSKSKDKDEEGKGLPSPGAGWPGQLGLLYAQGDTLFETLMLNLTLLKDGMELWGEEKPVWERERPRSEERTEIAVPDNQSELLTLQSRRLLLKRANGMVTGYTLLGGDFFSKGNAFAEQMTQWRLASKPGAVPVVYQPRRHDPQKQLWRDFQLLAAYGEGLRRPGVVEWIAVLKDRGTLPRQYLDLRTASIQYGDKDFFVADVFGDSLSFRAELITQLHTGWVRRIIGEVEYGGKLAMQTVYFTKELDKAAGGSGERGVEAARGELYYRFDQPFRQWLLAIDPEDEEMDEACERWRQTARSIALALGRELVEQAGPKAMTGRKVKEKAKNGKEEERLYTAPKAYNHFLYNIAKQNG